METETLRALGESVPENIFFGTSTWTYPGWKGNIYQDTYKSDTAFRRESLREYSNYPLFRTVGIDSFFYNPPSTGKLEEYAALVPEEFRWVQKVWEEITAPFFSKHKRYGQKAGTINPHFLDTDLFEEKVLAPNSIAMAAKHRGPFVFQFPTISAKVLAPAAFFDGLDRFFASASADYQYAVEIRNPEFLCNRYFEVLNKHGVTHCFNHWNYMPSLLTQMKAAAVAGGLQAPFFVARLLTPHGISYQEAVKRFSPYDSLKTPNEEMRADVIRLANRAIERSVDAFIIVNNRSEGYAPGTIKAIAEQIAKQ